MSNSSFLGGLTGFIVAVTMQPLEIIKTTLIINPTNNPLLSSSSLLSSFIFSTNEIYTHEGIKGFYRGLRPAILRLVISNSIFFTCLMKLEEMTKYTKNASLLGSHENESYKKNINNSSNIKNCEKIIENSEMIDKKNIEHKIKENKNINHFINSGIARIMSGVLTNPITVVRTRFEVLGFDKYHGILDGFRKIWKHEGIKGFGAGTLSTAIKDAPFAGLKIIILLFYEN